MNPGGARRGRGRGCKPVGPSIHSLRILATFYQGIQSQNISIHGGMAARGTTLPPFVHHSLLLLFPRSHHRVPHASATWHVHSTPFHEKESVRMITGIQIKARLVRSWSIVFFFFFFFFFFLVRSEYSNDVGNDFREPRFFPSSSKNTSSTFFAGWRGE